MLRLLGVLVGAGIVTVIVLARRHWLREEQAAIDRRIQANRAKTTSAFALADEGMRGRSIERRKQADRLRRSAAQVESGAHSRGDLRAVK